MAGADFRILGPLEVVGPCGRVNIAAPKMRAVLGLLLLSVDRVVSVDRMIDAVWDEMPPPSAVPSLRVLVSRVRAALEGVGLADRLVTRAPGYLLSLDEDDQLDMTRFEGLVAAARSAADPGEAVALLASALDLWRGDVLADLDAPWASVEIARLTELRLRAEEDRAAAWLASGRPADAVGELERLTHQQPLREARWTMRMRALEACGRQAEALRAYQDYRTILGEELGLEPGSEVRELERRISVGADDLPSGVLTFLMTDIEGSAARWDQDPDAMAEALVLHDRLISEAVVVCRGRVLKSKGEGDATVSVFEYASEAVAAALDAQDRLRLAAWPATGPLRVRMALHSGETRERDGDYFGPTLNRAARIRSLAVGGQVLCSQVTADLVRHSLPVAASLVDVGEHDLRGVTAPERVFQICVEGADPGPAPGASRISIEVPRGLKSESAFVGRTEELARIHAALKGATAGACLVTLVGEPGVGKTRLVGEVACAAHRTGWTVLLGRSDEDMGAAYQPFVEAVRPWITAVGEARLKARLGSAASDLARLFPELGTPAAGGEEDRLRLFEAYTHLVEDAAARSDRGMLLVLDDLHWATTPTLALLRYLLRTLSGSPVVIVATYRDTDLGRAYPLAELLPELRRTDGFLRIPLRGLAEDEVADYLMAAAGADAVDARVTDLAAALCQETRGNPFFVGEVVAHLVEAGTVFQDDDGRWTAAVDDIAAISLPESIREVIGRRLKRLSLGTNGVLTVAAVAGHEVDLNILEAVLGDVDVLGELEPAIDGGLVSEIGPARFAFAHGLVRQTIVQELGLTRKLQLHRQIAEALDRASGGSAAVAPPPLLPALAFHFAAASPLSDREKMASYALAAAEDARRRVAYEEGVPILQRALSAVDLQEPVDRRLRARLRAGLAEVLATIGMADRSDQAVALAAADDARAVGDAELLGRAAMGYQCLQAGLPDPTGAALYEEALSALGTDHPELRAMLMARLARYLMWNEGRGWTLIETCREAVRLAASSGSEYAECRARVALEICLAGTPDLDAQRDASCALLDLARRANEPMAESEAHLGLCVVAAAEGDRAGLLEHGERAASLDTVYSGGLFRHEIGALVDLAEGRFAELDAHTEAMVEMDRGLLTDFAAAQASLSGRGDAASITMVHTFLRMRDTGEIEALLPLIDVAQEVYPALAVLSPSKVAVQAETGRVDDARDLYTDLIGDDLAAVARDAFWSTSLALLTEACWALSDTASAEVLIGHFRPYAGQFVLIGRPAGLLGAVDRYLAILATMLGDHTAAEEWFEAALELEARFPAPALICRTQLWYGRCLLPRDPTRAASLLGLARDGATSLGMARVAADAAALLS